MQIYLLPWMPWPLPLPELVNFGFAVDLLDLQPRCVLLHTSSAEAPVRAWMHAWVSAWIGCCCCRACQPLQDEGTP